MDVVVGPGRCDLLVAVVPVPAVDVTLWVSQAFGATGLPRVRERVPPWQVILVEHRLVV